MTADVLARRRLIATEKAPHDTTVNIRMSLITKHLIDTAAGILGKSRSEFITESARQNAVDVMLDQRLFLVSQEQYETFQRALDNPPAPNERLKKLMRRTPLWEKT
jgi:uncharacterized protein (DUF1778 family)